MKIYNTLTTELQEFVPINKKEINIYVCGPTVYNFIHIGNARPICVFDTLRRYFEYRGYKVNFVQNFTDVDDKIINKANEMGVTPLEISTKYIEEFTKDSQGLNVKTPTYSPKVTENIENIINLVDTLIQKEYAYSINGDVYFRTDKFNEYGKLSHMPLDDIRSGARISVSEQKENPTDFALWKNAKENEPSWVAPWGSGRPGWHIECSAMAKNILGDTIDIHCGGQDLIFPHHENEIAQSECANGVPFANYWMHNGYLNIDNKKMSKSTGNFLTTRAIAENYSYEAIRFMMISAHYRSPINYTLDVINSCVSSLERLYNCKDLLLSSKGKLADIKVTNEQLNELNAHKEKFIEALEYDFNTADAIATVFELVRDINVNIANNREKEIIGNEYIEKSMTIYLELCDVLGLLYNDKKDEIPQEILDLVEKRKDARKNKDFALADAFRDEIIKKGYNVEETRQGTKITKN